MKQDIEFLGQAGFRFCFGEKVIYIDPYLSNSVAETESDDLQRLVEIPFEPEDVSDADILLITHDHQDHCDLATVLPLLDASRDCKVISTARVKEILADNGVDRDRLVLAREDWFPIGDNLEIRAIPAAHPTTLRDKDGNLSATGFLVRYMNRHVYHSGDTCVTQEIIDLLREAGVDTAILPVNEKNFFRDRRGIIGNMSVREAFQFAVEIGARTVIPMHWDMFAENCVYKDEIELLYKKISPDFDLVFAPRAGDREA